MKKFARKSVTRKQLLIEAHEKVYELMMETKLELPDCFGNYSERTVADTLGSPYEEAAIDIIQKAIREEKSMVKKIAFLTVLTTNYVDVDQSNQFTFFGLKRELENYKKVRSAYKHKKPFVISLESVCDADCEYISFRAARK